MDRKRLVFALIFAVISILLGYAIYRVFFKKIPAEKPLQTGITDTSGTFPAIESGGPKEGSIGPTGLPISDTKITPTGQETGESQLRLPRTASGEEPRLKKVVEAEVLSPSPTKNGGAKFYNQEDGKFYRLNPDGSMTPLSDKVFFNVSKATWSPSNNESIIEYPDGANIYYNFDTGRQVSLPKHWEEFSFSPQGEKVAAKSMGLSPDNRWLITSNPDSSEIKLVEPMGKNADKVTVDWSPNKQIVALSRTGDSLGSDRQEVLLVGQNKENFKSIVVEGRGLKTAWSASGGKLLHSVYNARNDFKPELWIVNAEGDNIGSNRKLLNVSTWADKCAMPDERFAYCGVPTTLQTGAGFAPDLANDTPDLLYKIDTVTGIKTQIPLEGFHVINKIIISPDAKTLYFTGKNETGLNQVKL
ncbi:MAG: hypothetical protein HYY51_01450 [Candidatus Magasanikbacteria bacterium]|nr:hypothetical protein [Candidatus Magasanikbacteria bacterium]